MCLQYIFIALELQSWLSYFMTLCATLPNSKEYLCPCASNQITLPSQKGLTSFVGPTQHLNLCSQTIIILLNVDGTSIHRQGSEARKESCHQDKWSDLTVASQMCVLNMCLRQRCPDFLCFSVLAFSSSSIAKVRWWWLWLAKMKRDILKTTKVLLQWMSLIPVLGGERQADLCDFQTTFV